MATDSSYGLQELVIIITPVGTSGDAGYRYVLISEGDNASVTDCKPDDATPGADIDAVGLYRNGNVEAFCQSVEWRTGGYRGTAYCLGMDPTQADVAGAVGAPDACVADYSTPECPVLELEKWVWLNGGEIVCDLGPGVQIKKDDNIAVYEVFNPNKAGSIESYSVKIAESADGPWLDLGGASGIAAVRVPEL